jgi:hypothetical protein
MARCVLLAFLAFAARADARSGDPGAVPAEVRSAPSGAAKSDDVARLERDLMLSDVSSCRSGMVRCWHLIFGAGDAPTRKLYFADFRVRTPAAEPGVAELDAIEALEGHATNDHLVYVLQFRCARKQFRILTGYAYMLNGRIDRAPGATQWMRVVPSWFERAGQVACDQQVRVAPEAHQMAWYGNMYRPTDVVDYTRRFLWGP